MQANLIRRQLNFRPIALGILAVILPFVATVVSNRLGLGTRAPYALSLLAIAIVASLGSPMASIIAVVSASASRFLFVRLTGQALPLNRLEAIRVGVLLLAGLIVSFVTRTRRKAQAAVEEAHGELQERTDALVASLHSSKCASWSLNVEAGTDPTWFSGSYQIFGRPFNEVGRLETFQNQIHEDDRDRLAAVTDQMRTSHEPLLCEFRARLPGGEVHWFEMRATRVPGKLAIWRGLTMDITDRKLTELALLKSEKLAAMGRLASTVAHEINNPLESVTNLLYLAQKDTTLVADTRAYLATAEQELARLGDITRLTLGFVRNNSIRSRVEIALIADEVLSIFRHRLESKGIAIERIYQPEVCIDIAPHELRQILTNLVSNAADAMSGSPSRVAIQIETHSTSKVRVLVEDTGIGIDPAAITKVFEPFFTTKEDTGTGIGLWVTRELVESNGGHIAAESGILGNGVRTRFTIEFPGSRL